ncbi:MAG: hypothetical protein ACKOQR_12950, partial [Dolichospermum sp.]
MQSQFATVVLTARVTVCDMGFFSFLGEIVLNKPRIPSLGSGYRDKTQPWTGGDGGGSGYRGRTRPRRWTGEITRRVNTEG